MVMPIEIQVFNTARSFRHDRVRLASGPICAHQGDSTVRVVFDEEEMHLVDGRLVEALEPIPAQTTPENS